jgi:hypothetical protein
MLHVRVGGPQWIGGGRVTVAGASGTQEDLDQEVAPPASDVAPPAGLATGVLLTAAAWILSRGIDSIGWGPARNPFTFQPLLWGRWDSLNYGVIAAHGRTFGRCGSPGFPASSVTGYFKETWCGTAGWLPGFPWLTHALGTTGYPLGDSGLLISWLAMATALFLVWFGWGRDLSPVRAGALLLLFGLFPGSVYNFAFFPTSLALAGVVGAVLAATRGRYFIGAILMTLAGLCYPSAWFAAAGLAAGLVIVALPLGLWVVIRRALWGLAGLSSLVILAIHDQIDFGHANAYFVMQSIVGGPPVGFPGQPFLKRFGRDALSFQAVLALVLVGGAVIHTTVGWMRKERDAKRVYPAAVGVVVVLGLLVSIHVGVWNRSIVLAAPCVVCLRRLPLPLLLVVVAVVGATSAVVSHFFFNYTLV